MEPAIEPVQSKTDLKWKLGLGVLLAAALLSILFLLFVIKFDFKNLSVKPLPAPIVTSAPARLTMADFRKSLVKDVKASFTASKDAGILAYIDLASDEKDAFRSYRHYVSAFNKMKESYQKSKTEPVSTTLALIKKQFEQRIAMVELKNYAQILKYYKESDFVMPK